VTDFSRRHCVTLGQPFTVSSTSGEGWTFAHPDNVSRTLFCLLTLSGCANVQPSPEVLLTVNGCPRVTQCRLAVSLLTGNYRVHFVSADRPGRLCFIQHGQQITVSACRRLFSLRRALNNAVPYVRDNPDKLHLFVDNGSVVATGAASLSGL
jgi:hypothetical protein